MKKALFLFTVASALSMAAIASNEVKKVTGDPGKKDEKQTSFGLASGYFSLFSFISPTIEPSDTTHNRSAVAPLRKAGAIKE